MSTAETTFATYLDKWLPLQLELHESYIHLGALGRGKELPFGCSIGGFRCVVEAG